jgi:phenylalanyl-tRNA synthetase beta chain
LRDYIDIEEDPETLAGDLTMFGLNVEGIEGAGAEFEGVVFGKVIKVLDHPNADRLRVCRVDAGQEKELNIVCGAPNVREGLGVPVAVEGAVLPGGFRIKKTKLRGELSEGMICSEKELGIGDDESGIMELSFSAEPGEDLSRELVSDDVIIDIEVTPNRPDQLSHLGIAREISAMYSRELSIPGTMEMEPGGEFSLAVEDEEDCPRYSAALIDDVVIAESPGWLRKRLSSVGINTVNNIVDITNFVLLELGHPLHAFDRDSLGEDSILVRRGRSGESIITINGNNRELSEKHLLITDTDLPVGVAGIIGGQNTEVTENTNRILLESAVFNPRTIRAGRKALDIETEASYRFERGADPGVTVFALQRACYLIEELGAGKVQRRYIDKGAGNVSVSKIELDRNYVNKVIGTNLSSEEISEHLEKLNLNCSISGDLLQVEVPTYRLDLKEDIDLVEEVARSYGYNNIKGEGAGLRNLLPETDRKESRNRYLRNYMAARGYAEVITSSFMDSGDPDLFSWPDNDPRKKYIEVANPLTSSQTALRTSLLPGMLGVIRENQLVERKGIKIFELGKVFIPEKKGEGLPREELHLTALLTGNAFPRQWITAERGFDYFDMNGELESIISMFVPLEEISMEREIESEPGYIFKWFNRNRLVAESGIIPPGERYDTESEIFYFTIYLDASGDSFMDRHYEKPSPYPAVKRDLCVIAGERVGYSDIKKVVLRNAKYLEKITLFDYYRDIDSDEDSRSYTFSLSFRSDQGTLKDSRVNKIIDKILRALELELKVFLRKE